MRPEGPRGRVRRRRRTCRGRPPAVSAAGRHVLVDRDVSRGPRSRLRRRRDVSSLPPETLCAWCGGPLPELTARARSKRVDTLFCKPVCRKTAWRLGQRGIARGVNVRPMRVAYADPPLPGVRLGVFYQNKAGSITPRSSRSCVADFPDGWALSTSAKALRDLAPALSAERARLRLGEAASRARAEHGHPQHVGAADRRRRGASSGPACAIGSRRSPRGTAASFPGRKPLAFIAWLFACLGVLPGDNLFDKYPGTGIVSRAFAQLLRGTR